MTDQPQRRPTRPSDLLEPVRLAKVVRGTWTDYLVLFLRLMAGVSLIKGLYHWVQVCGIGAGPGPGFEAHTIAWQTTTVFFAVLDLVAAVGAPMLVVYGAETPRRSRPRPPVTLTFQWAAFTPTATT